MMLQNNVLMMFSSDKKTTETVSNQVVSVGEMHCLAVYFCLLSSHKPIEYVYSSCKRLSVSEQLCCVCFDCRWWEL